MGRGDNRNTPKMRQKKSQLKFKARAKNKLELLQEKLAKQVEKKSASSPKKAAPAPKTRTKKQASA